MEYVVRTAFNGTELKSLAPEVLDIARQAGWAIMQVYDRGGTEVIQKADNTPVTEADLAADQIIFEGLSRVLPDCPVWSEERKKPENRPSTVPFLLVDPLDGTKEFIKRNGEFTVNIALICDGLPVLGVIHAPALNESFIGLTGAGAFEVSRMDMFSKPIQARSNARARDELVIVESRSHGNKKHKQWLAGLKRPYSQVGVGSSLKFCRIAQGQADCYARYGPTSQWDTAAGQAILEAAGGQVTDDQGNRLTYGMAKEVLNPEFIATGPLAQGLRL